MIAALEGAEETEIVRQLLQPAQHDRRQQAGQRRSRPRPKAARQRVINIVNNFFHDRLASIPPIQQYMESFKG